MERGARSPLEFIKNNLAGEPEPQKAIDPQQVSNQVATDKAKAETPPPPPPGDDPMPVFEKTPAEPAPATEPSKEPTAEPEPDKAAAAPADLPVRENFNKLKKTLTEVYDEKNRLEKELEEYKTGAVIPEVLRQKEARITELERWEKLYNLKASKEYTEKFVAPINEKEGKLKALFKDYGIPDEALPKVVNAALNKTNRMELNQFLSEHLDDVGAYEAKQLISGIRETQTAAQAAEAEPAKMLEQMQQESAQVRAAQEAQRVGSIQSSAKGAWVKALVGIRNEGKVLELIRKDSDHEFNAKFVDPILTHAATEYGHFISDLAEAGIKELPENLATVVARAFLLAHASAVSIPSRNAAMREIEELTATSNRTSAFLRPQVGAGVGSAPAPAPDQPRTAKEDAQALINSVLSKKSR